MIDNADLSGAQMWATEALAQAEADTRNETRAPYTRWFAAKAAGAEEWAVVNATSTER